MAEVTIHGIRNCDTMKQARAWLDARDIAYRFHDYRTAGVERTTLERWVDVLGLEAVLNRAGTTFRKLPEAERMGIDRGRAIALMHAQPAMIKRPLLDADGRFVAGFKPALYEGVFDA